MAGGLRLLAAGSLIVVVAAGVAVSASARRDATQQSSARSVVFRAAADVLGIERRELRQLRRSGRSIADIAASKGTSVGALKAALVRAAERDLPGRGDHRDAGARQRLASASGEIDALITQVPRRAKRASGRLGQALTAAAANYLRVSENKLTRTMKSRRTLATVATAQKRSIGGLEAALRAAAAATLEQRKAAGELSAKKERKFRARAERKIERLLARAG